VRGEIGPRDEAAAFHGEAKWAAVDREREAAGRADVAPVLVGEAHRDLVVELGGEAREIDGHVERERRGRRQGQDARREWRRIERCRERRVTAARRNVGGRPRFRGAARPKQPYEREGGPDQSSARHRPRTLRAAPVVGNTVANYQEPSAARVAEIVRTTKTAAVVGMKDERSPDAAAYTVPQRMKALGIRLVPVNPTIERSLGVRALGSVAELGERVDLIQIFRRADRLPGLAREILAMAPERRPKVVWIQTGIVNDEAAEALAAAGIEVVMDRCFAVEAAILRR
jgi:predicted CoA-binding protein